jgi:hypothetical protein
MKARVQSEFMFLLHKTINWWGTKGPDRPVPKEGKGEGISRIIGKA